MIDSPKGEYVQWSKPTAEPAASLVAERLGQWQRDPSTGWAAHGLGGFGMAVLRALRGLSPGKTIAIAGEPVVFGRHPDCEVVLDAGAVSRQHARVFNTGGDYYVEDLHSRNRTFVNEKQIEEPTKLSENDHIRICDFVFEFHLDQPQAAIPLAEMERTQSAVVVVDDERPVGTSTVVSKLEVSTGSTGLRVTVNTEVKLKALLEISRDLGRALRLGEVLPKLLDNLFSIFLQADRGFIVLNEAATGRLVPKAFKHRRESAREPVRISRTILNGVIAGKEAVLSADAATDSRFEMSESVVGFQIHSMMCAPLIAGDGEVLGVIQVDALDPRRRFTRDDLDVLASVACQAAIVVENAQLHEIALQEQLLQRELALAHKVQQGLLPATPPRLDGYEFFDFYEPAHQLGGDYFDYIPLQNGRLLAVTLADVSGKGVSAALLMARLSAEVRYCLASFPTPAEAMARLNGIFCESRWEDRFVTLVSAVLDPVRHEVTLVNAGHLPPLCHRASGEIESVGESVSGLPLGVDSETVYDQCSLSMAPGDSLILYTDGIPDAMNASGEFYGGRRLRTQLERKSEHVAALGQQLLDDVRRFMGKRPQSDDICLTCFRRLS